MKLLIRQAGDKSVSSVCSELHIADTFLSRLVGLLGKKELKENEGLLISKCNSVHTLFMRFPIDVVFINRDKKVIDVVSGVKPYRMLLPRFKADSVLEMPAGAIERFRIQPGAEVVCQS